jgi:hypothetical protein
MFEVFDNFVPSEAQLEIIGTHYLGFPKEIPIYFAFQLAIVMTVWRYVVQFVVSGVFKYVEPNIGTEEDKKAVRIKAGESGFKLFYYAFSWIWLVSIVEKLNIWENTLNCIVDYPYEKSYSINAVYLWELGFYISGLVCHFTIETRRKDFVEMAVHHFATVVLLGFSYVYSYERIGLIVLVLHDISDIFLEMGKIFSYLDIDLVATLCFVGLILSWFFARLYFFPLKVLTSVWFEHYLLMDVPLARMFFVLLCVLQVLHVYWFSLILNLAYKKLFVEGAKIEDTREGETPPVKKEHKKTK